MYEKAEESMDIMSQKVDFRVHRKKHEKGALFTSFHAFFIISPLFQKVCFLKQRSVFCLIAISALSHDILNHMVGSGFCNNNDSVNGAAIEAKRLA